MSDYEAWRCKHDDSLFCPDEGCPKWHGCARDKGWKPGDPTPRPIIEGPQAATHPTPTEQAAMDARPEPDASGRPWPESHIADDIRARGLNVAVHNDYQQDGEHYTFWLFTDPASGKWFKGEGKSDAEALDQIRAQLADKQQPAQRHELAEEWLKLAEYGHVSDIVAHGDKMANALDAQAAEIAEKNTECWEYYRQAREWARQNAALREALEGADVKALVDTVQRHIKWLGKAGYIDAKSDLSMALASFQKGDNHES